MQFRAHYLQFISVMELAEQEIHVISLYGVHELMLWIAITLTVCNCGNLSITVHGWITISTHAFVAITSDSISMARCHGHYLLSCSFGYYMWTASTRYGTLVFLFFLASFFCKDKQKQSSYFNHSFPVPTSNMQRSHVLAITHMHMYLSLRTRPSKN